MSRRDSITSLQKELERLTLASENIRRTIERLEQQEPGPIPVRNVPRVTDRDGIVIQVGYSVTFLTKGKHKSTGGVVTRFSRNQERVFARDSAGNETSRAPYNVRITPH